jgi:hypothetical protein
MKYAYLLTAALVIGTLSSAVADEPAKNKKSGKSNPSGTWTWEADVGGNYIASELKLLLHGEKLTGEYSDNNVSLEIENGQYDGKTFSFTLEFDVDGTEIKAAVSGVATGDKMTGNTKLSINSQEMELPIDAKRDTKRKDVVGTWKLKVETDAGEVFEPTVVLSLEKGELAGSYDGQVAGKHDLQDVKLEKNKLSFTISGDAADGSTFLAKFTGKPRGNRIGGKSAVTIDGSELTAKVRGHRVTKKGKGKKKAEAAAGA